MNILIILVLACMCSSARMCLHQNITEDCVFHVSGMSVEMKTSYYPTGFQRVLIKNDFTVKTYKDSFFFFFL